jgi:hypothetical protein
MGLRAVGPDATSAALATYEDTDHVKQRFLAPRSERRYDEAPLPLESL